jgi:peptide/nickel transport system permease protein/oligopeptide transport system permease protein
MSTPPIDTFTMLRQNRTVQWTFGLLLLLFGLCFLGPLFSPYSSDILSENQFSPPSAQHWMGTDINGRDVLTMTLEGGRISLLVGLVGAGISLVIGTFYGLISGYMGGKIDLIMMRIVDIMYSLPRIVIVMVLIAIFDSQTKGLLDTFGWYDLVQYSRILLLFVGLGLVEWLTMARIVRGQVLSLKERQYVLASQTMGQSHWRIMTRHLLPNLIGIVIVYLTLTIPTVILEESFLSFLGLGVQAPQASWGTLLSDGASMINPIKIYWWLLFTPSLMMGLTLLALNFLGDALRDVYDPSAKK